MPIGDRLVARGAPAGAALAFVLAAPAIKPVVMVATVVAFPGQPAVAGPRFVASLAIRSSSKLGSHMRILRTCVPRAWHTRTGISGTRLNHACCLAAAGRRRWPTSRGP